MTKINPNSVSQPLHQALAKLDTDGKKGITSQTERDAAQKLLEHFQGKDNEYIQQLINEYDLKAYEQQASKDFVNKMKNLLNFDKRGNKSEIDKGDELNMLNTLINTAVGPDKAYAEAFKRVYLSEAGTLAEQNAELRNENINLKEENEKLKEENKVLQIKLQETLSKSQNTKQSVSKAKESMENIQNSTHNISENAKNCIEKVSGFANDIQKNCDNIEGIVNKVSDATEAFEQGKMTKATFENFTKEANKMLETKQYEIEKKQNEIEKEIEKFDEKTRKLKQEFEKQHPSEYGQVSDNNILEKIKLVFNEMNGKKGEEKVAKEGTGDNGELGFPINKFED